MHILCPWSNLQPNQGYVHEKLAKARVDPEWHTMLSDIMAEVKLKLGRMQGPFEAPSSWPKRCIAVAGNAEFAHCLAITVSPKNSWSLFSGATGQRWR